MQNWLFLIIINSIQKCYQKIGCCNAKHLFAYNLNCNTYRTHLCLVCDWCMWPTTTVLHICNIIKAAHFYRRWMNCFTKLPQLLNFELLCYFFCTEIPKGQPQSIFQFKALSDPAVKLFEVNKRRLTLVLLQLVLVCKP